MDTFTIGKVARMAEVGVETIRFYERRGLIEEPPRRVSGYRQYPKDTVDRVRFIRRAKELGFTLKEIKELLDLRLDPRTTCSDIRRRAETKIADVAQRVRSLQRMGRVLEKLAAECRGKGSVAASRCPILDALEERKQP